MFFSQSLFRVGLTILCLAISLVARAETMEVGDGELTQIKFNSGLGAAFYSEMGPVVTHQLGYRLGSQSKFFAGPEVEFVYFSPGTLFCVMAAIWREFNLPSMTRLTLGLGVSAGAAFASRVDRAVPTGLSVLADVWASYDVDDAVSLRTQLKPGHVSRNFMFILNFGVSFRFV